MNRGKAYEILTPHLNTFCTAGYSALVHQVGTTLTETVDAEGEPISIEISVQWADQKRRSIRVEAIAYGPASFRLERLVESIVLKPE